MSASPANPPHTAPTPRVVGILGLGAMGAGVAGDLKRSGFGVVSTGLGRTERSLERARTMGIELLPDLRQVIANCDTFLSIVPADQAEPLCDEVLAVLAGKPLHYIDCNSITPSKTLRIAARVKAAGAIFSDGGIIGPPPGGRAKTRLYVSGPDTEVLLALNSERMPVIRLNESLSQATEMKVLFAAANKGTIALLLNLLAASTKVGLHDRLLAELDTALPGLLNGVRFSASDLEDKAARWAIEMDDVSQGLIEMGAMGGFHAAAADGYRHLAEQLTQDAEPGVALERALRAWISRRD